MATGKQVGECRRCHEQRRLVARRLCDRCYVTTTRLGTLDDFPTLFGPVVWWCECAEPIEQRIPLFDCCQCGRCFRGFRSVEVGS